MLKTTKNVTISGTVTTENGKEQIMYLNGSVSENGNVTISKTINNKELYVANKTMCKEDYSEFEKEIDDIISE